MKNAEAVTGAIAQANEIAKLARAISCLRLEAEDGTHLKMVGQIGSETIRAAIDPFGERGKSIRANAYMDEIESKVNHAISMAVLPYIEKLQHHMLEGIKAAERGEAYNYLD